VEAAELSGGGGSQGRRRVGSRGEAKRGSAALVLAARVRFLLPLRASNGGDGMAAWRRESTATAQ
jgi:hypothetical protein